jgi:hypothetical protein
MAATPAAAAVPAVAAEPAAALTVADAKNLILVTYPKLYSRFNYAFYGHEDSAPLLEVIDVIRADVRAWLSSMPDNFKTSNHALSRPKFGLVFVLKHDKVHEVLGEAYCNAAADAVEKGWDECKKDLVVLKDDAPILETEDELRARLEEVVALNETLSAMLNSLVAKHYDPTIAACFETLLGKK